MKNLIMQMIREQEKMSEVEASDSSLQSLDGKGETGEDRMPLQEETLDFMDDLEESNYDIVYSIKQVVMDVLINTKISLFVVLVFAFYIVISLGVVKGGVASIFIQSLSLLLPLVAVFFQGVANALNTYGFRCRRDKDKIYISAGLLKKKRYAIPVDKINAVHIEYSFLGRILNRPYIKLINIGGEQEETAGTRLLLSAPIAQLKEQMNILLPELELPKQPCFTRQPKRIMVKKLIYVMITCAVVVAVALFLKEKFLKEYSEIVFITIIVCFVYMLVYVVLKSFTAGLQFTDRYVMSREGAFGKRITIIPYGKIQNICFRSGPVDALLGVKKMDLFILADITNTVNEFSAFPDEKCDELKKWIARTY